MTSPRSHRSSSKLVSPTTASSRLGGGAQLVLMYPMGTPESLLAKRPGGLLHSGIEARLCTQPCPAQPVPRALVLLSNSQGRDKGRTQGSLSGETHPTYQAPPSRPTCQRHLRPQPTRFRQLSLPPPPSPAPPSAGLRLLCPTRNSPHFRSSTNSGQATKRASPVISPPPAPRAAAPLCATPCRGADEQEAALAPRSSPLPD